MEDSASDVVRSAENLAAALNECPELKKLLLLREKIAANPELEGKLRQFKRASFNIESKRAQGDAVSFEEEQAVGRLYADVLFNEDGRVCLETEDRIFDILRKVYEIISDTEFARIQEETRV
ncbi:MAG: YlbF family regulator [Clostridiales bacterium]|jgi:cell fate (sporulation/competence/biofilm development) regulator YlbF (YheA/YmcA/DUF963 family)|nr:YlbF family regulator [Clostridiales bacterium]